MKQLAAAACAVVVLPSVLIGAAVGAVGRSVSDTAGGPWSGVASTVSDIPAVFLDLYQAAAAERAIPWQVLAGIGKIECDHGRAAACDTPNPAGAVGPMQFLPATFTAYAAASGDPHPSILDPRHAIHAAAAMLVAHGVHRDPSTAVFAYNHSKAYVAQAIAWAVAYGWAPADAGTLGTAVLGHPNIDLRPHSAGDVSAQRVDRRVLAVLLVLATRHRLGSVGPFVSGHSEFVAGTDRPSNHASGRAVDLPWIDGAPVSPANAAALVVAEEIAGLAAVLRPDELGSPWPLDIAGVESFTAGHHDHIHYGFDA